MNYTCCALVLLELSPFIVNLLFSNNKLILRKNAVILSVTTITFKPIEKNQVRLSTYQNLRQAHYKNT